MASVPGCLFSRISRIIPSVLLFLLLLCTITAVPAAGSGDQSAGAGDHPVIDAYFFYGDGCVHCENIKPFIADLVSRHPNLRLQFLEIYHNATNQKLFERFTSALGLKNVGVPVLIIGNHVLIGEIQIRNGAEPAIISLENNNFTADPTATPPGSSGNCPAASTDLTLPLVISCALIDSVNPCAFAVLVFLLLSIITLETRRRVLIVGGAYITAVFIFYLLSGIGLFTLIQGSGFSQVLFTASAVLAIVLGLLSILDTIRKKEGFILAIPVSKKETIERYIRTATLPVAFALGILVGIFELPCTGGIYLAILSMMSATFTFSQGLPYLILYNIIFVLPLIAILLVVSFGLSPEAINSWRLENRRLLRIATAVAMILIGAVMLSGWL